MKNRSFVWIGGGALLLAALLAVGAAQIKGSAGYAGAGPDFLPWTVSAAMAVLGVCLIAGALRSHAEWVSAPDFPPRWRAVAWIGAGLVLNALLIEHLGFILSCAVLFAFAARGFRVGSDARPTLRMFVQDLFIGAAISAPVFWLFTKVLGVTLPALVKAGAWI
jgi:putative tricarboxylic transport membrane protein